MQRKVLTCLITTILCQYVYANTETGKQASRGFDLDTLKARGLSVEVAEFFKEKKRFLPGMQHIQLLVNGVKIGRIQAQFDHAGTVCMNQNFLSQAHINLPSQPQTGSDCIDIKAVYPQTIIRLHPGREQIELIVPQEALRSDTGPTSTENYVTGGTAGVFNYDVLYMKNRSSTLQASTEAGINIGDWIVRSRQNYAHAETGQQFTHLNAYAQRTLMQHQSVVQIGQINAAGSMFDTPTLLGAQWFPEAALLRPAGNRVVVEGIAQTEARVEVRQNGALLYSTIVPPGPFSLTDIKLNNANVDLKVTVFEVNGAQHSFVVPASTFAVGFVPKEKSFSIAIGKPWNYGGANQQSGSNWLVNAMADLPLGSHANITTGAMLAQGYYAAGAQLSGAPIRSISLGLNTLLSHASAEEQNGAQIALNVSAQMSEAIGVSSSYSYQTTGFRHFADTQRRPSVDLPNDDIAIGYRAQQQVAFNLNYRHHALGGVGMGYSQYQGFTGEKSRRMTLRWSRTFKHANVSFGADRSMGTAPNTSLYAMLNIPLGATNASASTSRSGQNQRTGVTLNGRMNEFTHYRLATEINHQNQQIGTSASVSALSKYAQTHVNVSRYGAGSVSYAGKISGGAVLHDQGITLSPYAIRDTFTLLSVGNLPDVKIHTPQGAVWTDATGRAVAPAMPAYTHGRLQLVHKSLPKNADIKNGLFVIGMGRGAVNNIDFEVNQHRRILLKLLDEKGQLLAKGSTVLNQDGQWLSTVSNKGEVFLTEEQLQGPLTITNTAGASCQVTVTLPKQVDADAFFETAKAVCRDQPL